MNITRKAAHSNLCLRFGEVFMCKYDAGEEDVYTEEFLICSTQNRINADQ